MAKRDYYEVLGVDKNASPDEIKKAFRKAAVEHHPDRGGNEEKFKEINEAYEVLKDSSKRQRYDQFGHAGVGSSAASDGGNPFGGFGQGQEIHFDFGDLGLGDIFSNFFGGGGPRQQQQSRGRNVETAIDISFEQAVFGTEAHINLNLEDTCEHCKGTTVEPGHELKTCETCKGSGQVMHVTRTVFGNIQQATICPTCKGRGQVPEKECTVCHGKGTQRKQQEIDLKIPAGIDDGATIRLQERGEAIANGPKGDLYVNVRVKSHKKFIREGDLILSEETVEMVDAALGTEIEVDTVDGAVKMKVPAGTQSGTDFKLSGHGVPHLKGDSRGAHIVTLNVKIPTKMSKAQQELLKDFKNSEDKGFWKK
ncbi:MAG TPA: molecular chaperone DnaJ [Candidatus Saccharimonadales bacterium]|nr:molecular chaperone DnaJ [Candidatus Saccharimonadales bacterium]